MGYYGEHDQKIKSNRVVEERGVELNTGDLVRGGIGRPNNYFSSVERGKETARDAIQS